MIRLLPIRDERGQSLSIFVLLVTAALILTTGLVIDGGQKVVASSKAESAAAGAARAAQNAAATEALGGHDGTGVALAAARAFLAGQPDVQGSATLSAGIVTVRTTSAASTLFLSVIGISKVSSDGYAEANIVPTGATR